MPFVVTKRNKKLSKKKKYKAICQMVMRVETEEVVAEYSEKEIIDAMSLGTGRVVVNITNLRALELKMAEQLMSRVPEDLEKDTTLESLKVSLELID